MSYSDTIALKTTGLSATLRAPQVEVAGVTDDDRLGVRPTAARASRSSARASRGSTAGVRPNLCVPAHISSWHEVDVDSRRLERGDDLVVPRVSTLPGAEVRDAHCQPDLRDSLDRMRTKASKSRAFISGERLPTSRGPATNYAKSSCSTSSWRLVPGPFVLDVGAGSGTFTNRLSARGFEVTSTDVTDDALEVLRGRVSGTVERADATSLPFSAASFDAVVLGEVLEAHEDDDGACR